MFGQILLFIIWVYGQSEIIKKEKEKNCYPASCLPAGPQKQSYRPRPGLVCDFPTFNQFLEFGRESKPTVSEGTEHLSSVRRRVTMSRSNVGRYRGILQEEDFFIMFGFLRNIGTYISSHPSRVIPPNSYG